MLAMRHWDRHGDGGLSFTELGFGAAAIGNLFRSVSEEEARTVLDLAWNGGIRHFDTAPLYGHGLSETRLNPFLRGKPRDSYTISTKVGHLLKAVPRGHGSDGGIWVDIPSRQEAYDYSYEGVMRSLETSLERLGLDRIDVVYAHDLDLPNHGSQEALQARFDEFMSGGYKALLKLREEGAIRAFGAGINDWKAAQ